VLQELSVFRLLDWYFRFYNGGVIMSLSDYSFFAKQHHEESTIRRSMYSGSWYPGTKLELDAAVDSYLSTAETADIEGDVTGIVSPHAGYVYSGSIAACAYKPLIHKNIDVAIVLGNAHREGFKGAAIDSAKAYSNPLGTVDIDRDLSEKIVQTSSAITLNNTPHIQEHSLEMQIPFLQKTLKPGFKIVPILFGFDEDGAEQQLISALKDLLKNKKYILVASTDLTHFPSYENAKRIDRITVEKIASMDEDALRLHNETVMQEKIPGLSCVLCALSATTTVMALSRALGAVKGQVLKNANSGDLDIGSRNRVVGYGAVAFFTAE
jgi:MEMO1 family protein